MIGTIVNTVTIIAGTIIGTVLHRGVKEKYKEVLYTGLGLASLAIGLNATISHFSQSEYPVLFIVSLAVGGVIGTALDIDGRFKRLVDRHSHQTAAAGSRLAEGLSTAIDLHTTSAQLLHSKATLLQCRLMAMVNTFAGSGIGVSLSGTNPTPGYAGQLVVNHIEDVGYLRYEIGYAGAVSVVLLVFIWWCSKVCYKIFDTSDQ